MCRFPSPLPLCVYAPPAPRIYQTNIGYKNDITGFTQANSGARKPTRGRGYDCRKCGTRFRAMLPRPRLAHEGDSIYKTRKIIASPPSCGFPPHPYPLKRAPTVAGGHLRHSRTACSSLPLNAATKLCHLRRARLRRITAARRLRTLRLALGAHTVAACCGSTLSNRRRV